MSLNRALFEDKLPAVVSWGAKRAIVSACAGGASFVLYGSGAVLLLAGVVSSFIFLLPLFCIGYSWGKIGFITASGVFLGLLVLVEGPFVIGIPVTLVSVAYLIVAMTLRHKMVGETAYYYPVGRCCALVICVGLMLLSLGEASLFDPVRESVNSLKEPLLDHIREALPSGAFEQREQTEAIMRSLFDYLWGMCLGLWILILFTNASWAVRILGSRKESLRPSLQVIYMNLPRWMSGLFILIMAGMFFNPTNVFFKNAFVVVLLGYVLQGIGVVHLLVRTRCYQQEKKIKIILGFFYVCVVLFPWILGGVACLGLIDQGLELKQRIQHKRV